MALVDMKSNLAAGAGKPLGNPEGRHDPDPDLATSTLDDIKKPSGLNKSDDILKGALNFMLNRTNPGGRFYRVEPPGPSLEPNEARSKLDLAVAYAKTKGMDYLVQKVKNIPNPASKYLSNEKWSGFLVNLGTSGRGEQEEKGVMKLYNEGVSQYDRPNVGDYSSNFFTFQSPSGEIWPASSAQVGGKLLPAALLSALATETNLFLTDYFSNENAYGFTKNMQSVGTRYEMINGMVGTKGAKLSVTASPTNERNKNLSKIKTTTAFVSNALSIGGFIKDFMGNMKNSPGKSNYAGIDDDTQRYTPPKGVFHISPVFEGKQNPFNANQYKSATGIGYSKGVYKSDEGFTSEMTLRKSQFAGIEGSDGNMTYTPPTSVNIVNHLPGYDADGTGQGTTFFDTPDFTQEWSGFKTHWTDKNESQIQIMWGGTSAFQDSDQANRQAANTHNIPGQPNYTKYSQAPTNVEGLGGNQTNGIGFVGRYNGSLESYWDTQKVTLYSQHKEEKKDNYWNRGIGASWIPLTGDDSQEFWDATGERVLSGPRAMQRALERFGEVTKSPQFLLFEGKQFALNALNSTSETRVYNPLSLASSFSSLARLQRHLGLGYESTLAIDTRQGWLAGRNRYQSGYESGGTTHKQPDIKKVDPNRYSGAFEGVNKLKLLGAQALGKMTAGTDQTKYSQDITITKNGIKYQNIQTPKKAYFDSQKMGGTLSEETLDPSKGEGMPKYTVVSAQRPLTFRKDGKIKTQKRSAIEFIYAKYGKKPKEVSGGHSGYGNEDNKLAPKRESHKDHKGTLKHFDTMDTVKSAFKPDSDGMPSPPAGGYEKEGLFKGVDKALQPGKYDINMRIDGGRGFASAASPGTDKSDWKKSGKEDARGNKTYDNINVIPYKKPGGAQENKDFVPLKFLDIYNNKQIVFRAAFKSLTESVTPDWNSIDYIGRPDQLHVYKGVTRDLNMNFILYPYTYEELKYMWAKLNYLVGMAMPSYEKITGGGERMVPPFIKLTVGDLYKKCPGYLKSFNVDYDMDATWEINTGERLPKKISVTCDFIYIGEEQPKIDGNNYGFDAEKFNQNKIS